MGSLTPRNATEATEPPKETSEEIRPLSEEEARRLLEAAREDRLEALYVLALTTVVQELLGHANIAITLDRYSPCLGRGAPDEPFRVFPVEPMSRLAVSMASATAKAKVQK